MKKILILGKPNSGKSLLFNKLTGLKQKVANFPGVTVEVKTGYFRDLQIVDFPGVYSLMPLTKDERIAVEKFNLALRDPELAGVLCVLDATRLERSMLLGLQVLNAARQEKVPLCYAVNMMDEIEAHQATVDLGGIEKALGQQVLGISARTGKGLEDLQRQLLTIAGNPQEFVPKNSLMNEKADLHRQARELGRRFGPKTDLILKNQNRLDRVFLSSVGGGLAFLAVMVFLFQAIFTWATPVMDFVEAVISNAGEMVAGLFQQQVIQDFLKDAIFGGFGSFLVFVPQIFMLTFLIGILEDSGYLARAAIICHRPLSLFGLSGKSFVPLLSGHACAIPAIFAARTIESPKHRLLTNMAIPLMSCSARLPVYGLFIAALIPPTTYLGGLVGLQGLAFFGLYLFGILTAMVVTGLISRSKKLKENAAPFIIELPPYRLPHWRPLLQRSLSYSWAFITRAGWVIFAVTVIVWLLGYFPEGSGHLETSWLGRMGQWMEPLFAPLGVDWRYGVAILASFVAREVFVGTLGTLFGIEGGDENLAGVAEKVQASGLTTASGFALLIFYVIALQCASTLAVLRKETGNARMPVLLFVAYGLLAYVAATITHWALS